jgi:D-alanyl-D-alanine carboxypeptidase/D-alanyl-D-alanine-endopeptidase (penicillin-binding protein 4)
MIRKSLFIIISNIFLLCNIQAQDSLRDKLDSAIVHFDSLDILKNASWSFVVIDNKSGEITHSINSDLVLMPASTNKILTSAAALEILGPGKTFKTRFKISGTIDSSGTLKGNVHIIGDGDPSFGSHRFNSKTQMDSIFARAIRAFKKAGIKKIDGKVIADPSCFDNNIIPSSWQWDDMGNYYGAGTSGLSIHENYVDFVFKSKKKLKSDVELLDTEPSIPYLEIINEVTAAGKYTGDRVYIYGSPYSNLRFLKGTIPVNRKRFIVSGSIPDPAYYTSWYFNNILNQSGIPTLYPPTTTYMMEWQHEKKDSLDQKLVYTHISPELQHIIYHVNMYSNNMYAETLLKQIGRVSYKSGSSFAGIKGVNSFLRKRKIDTEGLSMRDGSGLSRQNVVSSKTLSQTINYMLNSKNRSYFEKSLPEAGVSGSVKYMFRKSPARGKIWAKSGTISGVKAYAGFTKTESGKELSFAIIVNQYSGTQKVLKEEIVKLLEVMQSI